MSKKIISFVLVTLLLLTAHLPASATYLQNDSVHKVSIEETVQPMYKYATNVLVSLNISNNTAQCVSHVTCVQGVTKIVVKMSLQKKTLLWWSNTEEWNATYNSTPIAHLAKSCGINSGTYRVKVKITVYSGSSSETITAYSPQKEC